MSQISKKARDRAALVMNDVQAALDQVLVRHGMVAQVISYRTAETYIRPTIHISELAQDKEGNLVTADPARAAYQRLAEGKKYPGLKKGWLDLVFDRGNRQFRVTGLNVKARKYPVRTVEILSDGSDDERNTMFAVGSVAAAFHKMGL